MFESIILGYKEGGFGINLKRECGSDKCEECN